MAVGDLYRLSVLYSNPNSGCNAANVLCYRQDDVLVFDEPGPDLVAAFKASAEAGIQSVVSTDWQIVTYRVRGLTDPTYGYDLEQSGVSGSQSGEPLPPQVAQLISWKTGRVGRHFNGRSYLPSTTEANQTRGNLIPLQLTGLQDLAEDMVVIGDGVTTANWQLGIYSTVEGFTPITHGIIRPSLKTMRNRASTTG